MSSPDINSVHKWTNKNVQEWFKQHNLREPMRTFDRKMNGRQLLALTRSDILESGLSSKQANRLLEKLNILKASSNNHGNQFHQVADVDDDDVAWGSDEFSDDENGACGYDEPTEPVFVPDRPARPVRRGHFAPPPVADDQDIYEDPDSDYEKMDGNDDNDGQVDYLDPSPGNIPILNNNAGMEDYIDPIDNDEDYEEPEPSNFMPPAQHRHQSLAEVPRTVNHAAEARKLSCPVPPSRDDAPVPPRRPHRNSTKVPTKPNPSVSTRPLPDKKPSANLAIRPAVVRPSSPGQLTQVAKKPPMAACIPKPKPPSSPPPDPVTEKMAALKLQSNSVPAKPTPNRNVQNQTRRPPTVGNENREPGVQNRKLEDQTWYRGKLDRPSAEERLKSSGKNGSYLVRCKEGNKEKPYVLSIFYERAYHLEIRRVENSRLALGKYRDDEKTFSSMIEMIEYYQVKDLLLEGKNITKLLHPA